MPLNIEFKARVNELSIYEEKIKQLNALFIGEDNQADTYFNVPNGRLKLRQGNIENALIHYVRSNIAGSKQSDVLLYQHQPDDTLKDILSTALGIKVVVEKKRRIWFINNVKFHFDTVNNLGSFVEVEAIDKDGKIGIEQLTEQCNFYKSLFSIDDADFIAESYSDMLLNKLA